MVEYFAMVLESLRGEHEGQGLVEYGLIVALIAVVCIGAVTLLGGNISNTLTAAANAI